jgi:predicted enzyme related to lactoylglutathione lyase
MTDQQLLIGLIESLADPTRRSKVEGSAGDGSLRANWNERGVNRQEMTGVERQLVVENVAATVAKAERLGAKALVPPTTAPDGLVFAQLHDPAGNQIGIFTPAPTP